MLPFALAPIATFLGNNVKWIVIGLLIVVVAFGAWRYTKLVENYAIAKQTISQLEQNVKDKEAALQIERDVAKLKDNVILKLNEDKDKLESQLESITENLGEDADDVAPASIRETIKRLKELK
jgi:predicted negative regulator of RcsB-dependent stress response